MNVFDELLSGGYWLYTLEYGGAGLVKADNKEDAKKKVRDAYTKHSDNPFTEEIKIWVLDQKPFDDAPDVMEIFSE